MSDCRLVPLPAAGFVCTRCGRTLPVIARRRCTAAGTIADQADAPRSLPEAVAAKLALGLADFSADDLADRLARCRACPAHDLAADACRDQRTTCGCPATERTARLIVAADGCQHLVAPEKTPGRPEGE